MKFAWRGQLTARTGLGIYQTEISQHYKTTGRIFGHEPDMYLMNFYFEESIYTRVCGTVSPWSPNCLDPWQRAYFAAILSDQVDCNGQTQYVHSVVDFSAGDQDM